MPYAVCTEERLNQSSHCVVLYPEAKAYVGFD